MGLWDFFKGLLNIDDIKSPREAIVKWALDHMLNPVSVDIVTQDYYDLLSFTLFFAVPAVFLGLAFAVWDSMVKRDSAPLRVWFVSSLVVVGAVSLLPPFILSVRVFFNLLGANFFQIALGSKKDGFSRIMQLTDNTGLDLILGTIQIAAVLFLAFEMVLILAALVASSIAIIIGCAFRSFPRIGEPSLNLGIRVTVYGVAGNFVGLVVMIIVVLLGRLVNSSDPTWVGLVNVTSFIAAAVVLWAMSKSMGSTLRATVTGIIGGVSALRGGHGKSSDDGYKSGGGEEQTEQEVRDHDRHSSSAPRRGRKRRGEDTSGHSSSDTSDKSSGKERPEDDTSPDRQATDRRHSKTRTRLRGRSDDDQSVSERNQRESDEREQRRQEHARDENDTRRSSESADREEDASRGSHEDSSASKSDRRDDGNQRQTRDQDGHDAPNDLPPTHERG